jgi:hypothetical protein
MTGVVSLDLGARIVGRGSVFLVAWAAMGLLATMGD